MTCKVKVTTQDGSSTIARALIDPGFQLLLFMSELLNIYVCHTEEVWFQVSGIEDDAEKIGVEAYVLKKITKDLPLHPIPLSLKRDHISDLELADPEFRTSACIDFVLGAEVFTSILCDGRQTGPQGTPSAINTCLWWVLFGKIQNSDVVDVANHTLKQDELKYVWLDRDDLMRLFLQLIRKMTSITHDGGADEWLRDHHLIWGVNLLTMTVELYDEC